MTPVSAGPSSDEAELLGLELDGGLAGHLGHHEPGAVPHRVGVDVLVRVLAAGDRRHVEPGLVRERRRADVGLLGVRGDVHDLGDVVRRGGQPLQPSRRQGAYAHLQGEVRDDRGEVAVAGALAVAVHRPLHLHGAAAHAGEGVGDAAAGVVVEVDADLDVVAEVAGDLADDRLDLVGQRAAVRVAEDERLRTVLGGGLEDPQRELGVVLPAVEEVLGVEQDAEALAGEELDRVGHHGLALVERGPQRLGHVVVPRLAHDARRGRPGVDQVLERDVLVDLAPGAAGRAEGDDAWSAPGAARARPARRTRCPWGWRRASRPR